MKCRIPRGAIPVRVAFFVLALSASAPLAQAEENRRERVAYARTSARLSLEATFDCAIAHRAGYEGLALGAAMQMELRGGRAAYAGCALPAALELFPRGLLPSATWGPGDPSLYAGMELRSAAARYALECGISLPLGASPGRQNPRNFLVAGAGRTSLSLALAATRFSDPAALWARLEWTIGLPRAEARLSSWRPGDLALSLGVTEALSANLALGASVTGRYSAPEMHGLCAAPDSPNFGAAVSVRITRSFGSRRTAFTVFRELPGGEPRFGLGLGAEIPLHPKGARP